MIYEPFKYKILINYKIKNLSNKSIGIPWGDCKSVPLIVQIPLLVANMTIGAKEDSKALFK